LEERDFFRCRKGIEDYFNHDFLWFNSDSIITGKKNSVKFDSATFNKYRNNMPLGFPSINRGTIAFGFFNIDTDLLLLEHYFLFGHKFCGYISQLAEDKGKGSLEMCWQVYSIENEIEIGDLMGAIHGIYYKGFIGEVYRQFPFPDDPEDFKQKPDALQNRSVVEKMIEKYAIEISIPFKATPPLCPPPSKGRAWEEVDQEKATIRIGEYLFDRDSFQRIVHYVWRGGYPGWKEGIRPDYVLEMKGKIEKGQSWVFAGLLLND